MKSIFLTAILFMAVIANGQELKPQDLYKKSLPSIMTLSVRKADGSVGMGSAFMAEKEGLAITAWHVVAGANSVTAKFSDGEEFEVSGLVDKDEKRDVAIIRVKVFGRPLVPLMTADPEIASKVYIIGAPRGLEFSISDGLMSQIQLMAGMKQYQFTCPASPGNSGSPLLNSNGEAIGVVSWQIREGQNLNFAVPVSYVKGLDVSLATRPWSQVESGGTAFATRTSNANMDKLLAKIILLETDLQVAANVTFKQVVHKNYGFKNGVPSGLYSEQMQLDQTLKQLDTVATDDQNRARILVATKHDAGIVREATQFLVDAIRSAQINNGWGPQATDLLSRSSATVSLANQTDTAMLRSLSTSPDFVNSFPRDTKIRLGLIPDSANFVLGVLTYSSEGLRLINVEDGSLASNLDLKSGDIIRSVDNVKPSDLQDVKLLIKKAHGRSIVIVVSRYDEWYEKWSDEVLKNDVPESLPQR